MTLMFTPKVVQPLLDAGAVDIAISILTAWPAVGGIRLVIWTRLSIFH
jgi:hypothetical protein